VPIRDKLDPEEYDLESEEGIKEFDLKQKAIDTKNFEEYPDLFREELVAR
jgi:hypothetical protein